MSIVRLFEINTRVWITQFSTPEKRAVLSDVPVSYWQDLVSLGFDAVWLMGIWKTNSSTAEKHAHDYGLVQSYDRALKDWVKEDVIGSPYAIDVYELNPMLGTEDDFNYLREQLKITGLKLILDFVPNHFSEGSSYLETNPEYFLPGTEQRLEDDDHTFFRSTVHAERIFAHGRDPFFPAWTDTVQVDYSNPETQQFMITLLHALSEKCDGVRCDMAMLVLNNVFHNTWIGIAPSAEGQPEEFWHAAIESVKTKSPEFLFIAEAYWDLEWKLQQLGFDYTYDKRLHDRLKSASVHAIQDHLRADAVFQKKSVRFLENHDEERAIAEYGFERSLAAAVILCSIPGLHLFHDGQMEGRKVKLPVQLGRTPEEVKNLAVEAHYHALLSGISPKMPRNGEWELLFPKPAAENNHTNGNILAWIWSYNDDRMLVAVNYSDAAAQCRLKFAVRETDGLLLLRDVLSETQYERKTEEIRANGLYIDLPPYQSHVFVFFITSSQALF